MILPIKNINRSVKFINYFKNFMNMDTNMTFRRNGKKVQDFVVMLNVKMSVVLNTPRINLMYPKKEIIMHVCRSKSNKSMSSAEYCMDLVKKYDYENFLCSLLVPSKVRSIAFAVRAFNIEVARVQDQVSQVQLGQMRLNFWIETVERLFQNDVREHPVAVELFRTVKNQNLSKKHLKNLILSRMNPISSNSFRSLQDMEKYSENSVSPVYYIILESAGLGNVNTDHAASHLGKAQGIVNLLRSVPISLQTKALPLPQDLLLEQNLSQEKVLRGHNDSAVKDVVFKVATHAKQHLEKARNLKKRCPKEASSLFLPAVCVDSYLQRLQKADFNVFDKKLQVRNNFLPLKLYWSNLLKKY